MSPSIASPPNYTCPKCGCPIWMGPKFRHSSFEDHTKEVLEWECQQCLFKAYTRPLDYPKEP